MTQKFLPTPPAVMDSMQPTAMRIKRYQWSLYVIGLLVCIGITTFFFFKRYQRRQNEVAQNEMFQAIYAFEKGAFDKALRGDGTYAGLLDIAREYRFTQAANLANFYIGVMYMHQKNYDKAVHHLTQFSAKDLLLQARAWALVGDALTLQKAYAKAAQYYTKAAKYRPNSMFTPIYLVKAALAYEAKQNFEAALSCYQLIVKDFPEAVQHGTALKHIARLKMIISKQLLSSNQQTTT